MPREGCLEGASVSRVEDARGQLLVQVQPGSCSAQRCSDVGVRHSRLWLLREVLDAWLGSCKSVGGGSWLLRSPRPSGRHTVSVA